MYGTAPVPYVPYFRKQKNRADYSSLFLDNPTLTDGVIHGPFFIGILFCPISVSPSSSNLNSIMPLILYNVMPPVFLKRRDKFGCDDLTFGSHLDRHLMPTGLCKSCVQLLHSHHLCT